MVTSVIHNLDSRMHGNGTHELTHEILRELKNDSATSEKAWDAFARGCRYFEGLKSIIQPEQSS